MDFIIMCIWTFIHATIGSLVLSIIIGGGLAIIGVIVASLIGLFK